nr:putative leucine-rich repeat receptor-like serine/threonine-protein kinase At2g14440 [Tanacetum cinerariifolium]
MEQNYPPLTAENKNLGTQKLNLSENSIQGNIPSSLGKISSLEVLDLSYNFFNDTIPESLGGLTSVRILNLNGNSLSGRVPAALGGRLLHRASFNFTDNDGLCGIPGLPTCGPHLSAGAKIAIALGACAGLLLVATCLTCWWKRRQNILRAQQIAGKIFTSSSSNTFSHITAMFYTCMIGRTMKWLLLDPFIH